MHSKIDTLQGSIKLLWINFTLRLRSHVQCPSGLADTV